MRKKIVAGNWKMNLDAQEAHQLVEELKAQLKTTEVEVIIIPPFVHLGAVQKSIQASSIQLGAQNVHAQKEGAYTGEVSAKMLKSVGASYALVGHSERRVYQNETKKELQDKIARLFEEDICPIFCVGEHLEERKNNQHFERVAEQLSVIKEMSAKEAQSCIIAYEPVWAIGTGETASSAQAEEMHAFIRQQLENDHGKEIAESISILYGGSCKPNNAKELFAMPNVDGGLIGGASLAAGDFVAIVNSHA